MLGATRDKTRVFPDNRRTKQLKFLKKLTEESQRSCRKSLAESKTAYYAH